MSERGRREMSSGVSAGTRALKGRQESQDFAPIGDVVERWLKNHRVRARVDPASLFGKWREVVGQEIASQTRVIDLKGGELIVEVRSAPLLNELATYYCQEILESLRRVAEFQGVRTIRFKSGSF